MDSELRPPIRNGGSSHRRSYSLEANKASNHIAPSEEKDRPSGGRNLRSSRDELRQETVPEEFERMSLHDSQYPPRPPSGGMQGYLPREGAAAPPLPRPPTRERDSQPSTSQHLQQQTYHHHHHQQQQQVHQQQTQTQHKPRSHRRTGSLETTQFQGLHGYLYQPTNMYSLPEDGPSNAHPTFFPPPPPYHPHAPLLSPMPPPGPHTPRGSQTSGYPLPSAALHPPLRLQPVPYGAQYSQGVSPTLTYVAPPSPAAYQPSPRYPVPPSPQGGTPPAHPWPPYPPHMSLQLGLGSPPQPAPHPLLYSHLPQPPRHQRKPSSDDFGSLDPQAASVHWGSGSSASLTAPESPYPRFKISAYTGGVFAGGRMQRGSYTGGECRLVEVSNLQFQSIASLTGLLFRGRADASLSERLTLRYYHPLLRKLVGIYTDDDVCTMLEEWRQWREDPRLEREPLHLYGTREGSSGTQTPRGRGASSRLSSPAPSELSPTAADPRQLTSGRSSVRQSGSPVPTAAHSLLSHSHSHSNSHAHALVARRLESTASVPAGAGSVRGSLEAADAERLSAPPAGPLPVQFGFHPPAPSPAPRGASPPRPSSITAHRRNSSNIPAVSVEVEVIDPRDITRERVLGEGSFGTVYRGTYQDHQVAIKTFYRGSFLSASSDAIQEARMLSKLRHPNVVLLYGIVLPAGPEDGEGAAVDFREPASALSRDRSDGAFDRFVGPALVTEYMEGGSLQDLLRRNHQLGRKVIVKLALDAANGLKYLHSKGCIHFDLKSANLLLAWETIRDISRAPSRTLQLDAPDTPSAATVPAKPRRILKCCVGDFGLSRLRDQSKEHVSLGPGGNPVGTVSWTAPEIYDISSKRSKDRDGLSRDPSQQNALAAAASASASFIDASLNPGPTSPYDTAAGIPNRNGTAVFHPNASQPRLTSSSPGASRRVDSKVDVFSFGVVLWELWTRKEPYGHLEARTDMTIMYFVAGGGRPPIPGTDEWIEAYGPAAPSPPEPYEGYRELMCECWHREPEQRPAFDVICRRLREGLDQIADDE